MYVSNQLISNLTLLAKRSIENSIGAVLILQVQGAPEDSTKRYILTEQHRAFVSAQSDVHRIVDGCEHVHFDSFAIDIW